MNPSPIWWKPGPIRWRVAQPRSVLRSCLDWRGSWSMPCSMTRSRFSLFNVTGALLWVVGLMGAGYFFGNLEWVKNHLEAIIWALILVPGLMAVYGGWKSGRRQHGGMV